MPLCTGQAESKRGAGRLRLAWNVGPQACGSRKEGTRIFRIVDGTGGVRRRRRLAYEEGYGQHRQHCHTDTTGSLSGPCRLLYAALNVHAPTRCPFPRPPCPHADAFGAAVTARLQLALGQLEAESTTTATTSSSSAPAPAPSGVPLAHVSASLLWLPAAYGWVRPAVVRLVGALAGGVGGVLAAADAGRLHIAPALMEEVQVGGRHRCRRVGVAASGYRRGRWGDGGMHWR